jgi:hypothetical protein
VKLKIKNSKMKYSIKFQSPKVREKEKNKITRCLYLICSVVVIATMQEPICFKYGDFKPFFPLEIYPILAKLIESEVTSYIWKLLKMRNEATSNSILGMLNHPSSTRDNFLSFLIRTSVHFITTLSFLPHSITLFNTFSNKYLSPFYNYLAIFISFYYPI